MALGAAGFEAATDVGSRFVDAAEQIWFEEGAGFEERQGVEAVDAVGATHVGSEQLGIAFDGGLAVRVGLAGEDWETLAAGAALGAVVEGG